MRGSDTFTESLFSIKKLDDFVPATHPLRAIRAMVNDALVELEDLFAGMYEDASKGGRPSIAPQKLLRAMLLQVLYSVRSERLLMEQVQYNLLFRWFIGLSMEDSVWVPTVFSKNRQRLIEHDAVVAFFNQVLAQAQRRNWLSKEHFSVDGTLIQAWASHKSFVPKDGDGGGSGGSDFRGHPRSNDTHESKSDPDSRLYRKGKTASEMRFMGHTLMENRNGLIVNAMGTQADGYAERVAAKEMINDVRQTNPDAHSIDGGQSFHSHRGQRSMRWRTRCAGVLSDEQIVAVVSAIGVEPMAGRCPSSGPGDLSHGLAFEGHLVRAVDDAVKDGVGQRGLVQPGVPGRHRQLAGDER